MSQASTPVTVLVQQASGAVVRVEVPDAVAVRVWSPNDDIQVIVEPTPPRWSFGDEGER